MLWKSYSAVAQFYCCCGEKWISTGVRPGVSEALVEAKYPSPKISAPSICGALLRKNMPGNHSWNANFPAAVFQGRGKNRRRVLQRNDLLRMTGKRVSQLLLRRQVGVNELITLPLLRSPARQGGDYWSWRQSLTCSVTSTERGPQEFKERLLQLFKLRDWSVSVYQSLTPNPADAHWGLTAALIFIRRN